ncbi:Hypothetical protein, partial CDS, partial [Neorhizobium galegae bv. officinalis]
VVIELTHQNCLEKIAPASKRGDSHAMINDGPPFLRGQFSDAFNYGFRISLGKIKISNKQ